MKYFLAFSLVYALTQYNSTIKAAVTQVKDSVTQLKVTLK